MIVKDNARPAESGHWYYKDGEPCYEIMAKNGKLRPTTLTDAKKHSLIPSVTTVIKLLDKPALVTWAQKQVLLSTLKLPQLNGESEEDYCKRIMEDSKEESRKAAERGTIIHAGIQKWFEGEQVPEYQKHYENVLQALNTNFGERNWIAEKSFAHSLGYGGKVDLHSPITPYVDHGYVVDIKTKDKDLDKAEPYPEHIYQLAAYRNGLEMDMARCAIIFVHSETGEVKFCEIDEGEIDRGWQIFQSLCYIFYLIKRLRILG